MSLPSPTSLESVHQLIKGKLKLETSMILMAKTMVSPMILMVKTMVSPIFNGKNHGVPHI